MKTFLKAVGIIAVFSLCLLLLLYLKGEKSTGRIVTKTIFIEDAADWKKCQLYKCFIDQNTNTVQLNDFSSLVTFPITPGFEFDKLVISWNAHQHAQLPYLFIELEVSSDLINWHRFSYLSWGKKDSVAISLIYGYSDKAPLKIENVGFVDDDVLKLDKGMRYARAIVQIVNNTSISETPIDGAFELRRLAFSFSTRSATNEEFRNFSPKREKIKIDHTALAVPYLTQRSLPKPISGECCSPTAVAMVLNYHGINIDHETFAHQVYDPYNAMFGNWPYNVQAAYVAGLSKTWVDQHTSFDELYDEIKSGKPVVISISYGYDELPNSPIHEAPGHLVTVVGFWGPDTIICNDPSGHDPNDGICKFPRYELEKAWLGHGGVAYHLWP